MKILNRINLSENNIGYEILITENGKSLNIYTTTCAITDIEFDCGVFHKNNIKLQSLTRKINSLLLD